MNVAEAFRLGGWGMWPTFFFGLVTIGVAVYYAVRPERRLLPLLASLGLMTLVSGCLGFITGVIRSFTYIEKVGPDQRYVALIGVAESLHNVAFALVLIMLAAIALTIGVWRLARVVPSRGSAATPA